MRRQDLGLSFEKTRKQQLEDLGYFAFKMPDTRAIRGLVHAALGSSAYTAVKVPCDLIAIKDGVVRFEECKQTQQASFPIRNVEEHQIKDMLSIQQHGGNAWFVINFYVREKYAREASRDEVVMVTPTKLVELIERAHQMGRESIPREWMQE